MRNRKLSTVCQQNVQAVDVEENWIGKPTARLRPKSHISEVLSMTEHALDLRDVISVVEKDEKRRMTSYCNNYYSQLSPNGQTSRPRSLLELEKIVWIILGTHWSRTASNRRPRECSWRQRRTR